MMYTEAIALHIWDAEDTQLVLYQSQARLYI